jgi:hypothetical protein
MAERRRFQAAPRDSLIIRLMPASTPAVIPFETNAGFDCCLKVAVGSRQYVNAHCNHNNPPAAWFTPPQQKGEV